MWMTFWRARSPKKTALAIRISLRRAMSAPHASWVSNSCSRRKQSALPLPEIKITSVKTNKGELLTNTVVNAAGPYARQIAGFLGIDLPVVPIKRQIVTTAPLDFISESFPMVVDIGSGLYTHKESGGLLLGWADKNTPEGFDESVDPEYTDTILMKGLDRIPQLETAEIKTAWGGLYESTPDHLAVIGSSGVIPVSSIAPDFPGMALCMRPLPEL